MIIAAVVALALAQAPVSAPAEQDWNTLAEDLQKNAKALELKIKEKFESEEFKLKMLELEARAQALAMRQLPVPPVPPVAPSERQQMREKMRQPRERRRIPEGWVEATEPFSRTFKVTKGAAFLLSNVGGNIQVSPGNGDQVEVQAMKRAWGPNAEQAKQWLGDATIEVSSTANRVELRVDQQGRKGGGRGIEVEFDVKVPADTSVELRTVSGDVRVTNVRGEVRVNGVSGNLSLDGTPRVAAAKTISGDVTLTKAGGDAQLSVSTISGDMLLQSLTTRAIDLNTVSGNVRITGWSGDRAVLRTLSGDLHLEASFAKGGRYDLESHSGDIQLSLAEQPGFDLDASTFSGSIRVDFPVKSEAPVRESGRGPRSVRGTFGDASSSLRVQTFSGDLTVIRR